MVLFQCYLDHSDGYYDDYNPLFSEESILNGACRVCGDWFPTKKLLLQHRRKVHPRSREDNMDSI